MKVLCFHHNDADGRASAAIVRRAITSKVQYHEINYGDPIPWEKVESATWVIVVDFSFRLPDMQRMANGHRLTWIDHHKSSLESLAEFSTAWEGLRSLEQAACVLTWQHFFPDQPVPQAVRLIGDRDTWRNEIPASADFGEGLHREETSPSNDRMWKLLLDDDPQAVEALVTRGKLFRDERLKEIRRSTARYGYPVIFEGYRTLAINRRGEGDLGEHIRELGYEIGYSYVDAPQNGKIITFVTLTSSTVDVAEIAQKFGGGGHPGAAGFSFERQTDPFPPQADVQAA